MSALAMDLSSSGGLVSRDDLLECYLRCQQLEAKMRSRQSRGANSSGRYKKHDTARDRCLQRVLYPGLCMGKLPTADDAKMLFDLPGPNEILGPD